MTINSDRVLELRAWSCRWSTNKKHHLPINYFSIQAKQETVVLPALVIPLEMIPSEVCSPIDWTTSWIARLALGTFFLLHWPRADQVG